MKGRVLKVITVIMLIMTMTMANFILLGNGIVSYAADIIGSEQNTSHKNVAFSASLQTDAEENVDLKAKMNATDLK